MEAKQFSETSEEWSITKQIWKPQDYDGTET